MIQRIQTIWLLLASIAAFLTFKVAFYSGNIIGDDKIKIFSHLTAISYLPILALTAILGATAFIAIFLYKNRALQFRIVLAALLISIIIIVLYFLQSQKYLEGGYNITSIVSALIPILLILAARGINKDRKLVKSLDRLR